MNKRLVTVSCAACALAVSTLYAAHAHEHGVAKINASVEDQAVTIELETPLDSALGFERAPNGAAEEQAVKDMAAKLRKADALFAFSPKAACKLASVRLESEVLSAELLGEKAGGHAHHDDDHDHDADREDHEREHDGDHDDHDEHEHEAHADLDAEFAFVCQNPKALSKIDVNLFKSFPKLNKIEAQIVTAKGQSAVELTAKNATIKIAQ
ncbi:MAG: DUF2796 domain-containing protein [Helicobacteraceae bacterium]|jgi:hypothetical protein|nr:DUF2796 domain-containing protein [Helicobacteraceae bacterium]